LDFTTCPSLSIVPERLAMIGKTTESVRRDATDIAKLREFTVRLSFLLVFAQKVCEVHRFKGRQVCRVGLDVF
jgi:hypothetical protein